MGIVVRRLSAVVAAALLATLSSGCSDSGGGSSSSKSSAPGTGTASAGAATVTTRSGSLGKILVDSTGRTLYLFEADTSGTSTCSGDCAVAWPPLLAPGQPTAGGDAKADLLGITTRGDGGREVTYNGHPLYLYQGDRQPGDTNGQGLDQFGAKWYVLGPDGNKVTTSPKSTNSSGGGY
ncbi:MULTISPECIES: hypothetical protein [unclassified Embleya]|uniref:COG4315 family predicted lipoprotein n=1 Tax=unclassified Embleya TaxID=2699296 RepID=UPI0033E46AB2